MANSHVIHGLLNKRAILQAELEYHERRIGFCKIAIAHFDATLALYEETKGATRVSRRYFRNIRSTSFEYGLISKLALITLQESDRPLSTREILDNVRAALSTTLSSENERILSRTVRSMLSNKCQQGVLQGSILAGRLRIYKINNS
jgi:hypothetical protein